MRKLMWFAIGFALSCAATAYDMMYSWLPPAVMIAVAMATGAICLTKKRQFIRPMLMLLIGCLAGIFWFVGFYLVWLQPIKAVDGQLMQMSVTVSDFSYETPSGIGAEAVAVIKEKPCQIRIYINEEITLKPGDRVEGLFRLRLTMPESADESTYYQGQGTFLFAYQQEDIRITSAKDIPQWCFPAVLRQRILPILEDIFPADTAPFVKALLLGYTGELDYVTDTAFKISGIRHIIAVSGLHISILYGLIAVVTLRRRFLTALVGMPVLLLFAAVAGFTPSVNRACIMVWLMLASQIFDREYDAPTALAFAVLVMLLWNPLAVTSVSLQLSVGCVAGILLFNTSINSWMKNKLPKKKGMASKFQGMLCSGISVTVSAMSLVTPLSAAYFGTVSLVSVLTNLLTLWVVNLIFNGLIVTCILSLLSHGLAAAVASILSWPVRYVLAVSKTLASFPLAAVYTKSVYIVLWLIFVYLLLTVFLLMRRKHPDALLCCGVLGLCIALAASWAEPLTSDARITMLDVGQGQSILLQSDGKTFLVDCGGDSDERTADIIAETLLSQGISRLHGIIVTHYDRDHAGALHNLLTRIDTDYLFLPDTRSTLTIPETSGETIYVWEDVELTFGTACLRIFGPVYSGADNENSLCVLFDTENCDILITGDRSSFGERMLMRNRSLPDVDILVAGHHGAADSTTDELLRSVTPETVLISVGQDNIYGHPAPQLLQRLKQFGCSVYRTDLHGTITIRR